MTIFIPPDDIAKQKGIKLPPDKARYLATVLRSKAGDRIAVIDGRGKAYEAGIIKIAKSDIFIDMLREIPAAPESPAHLVLCQGILKGEKMDMVIQKATELGVKEIVPLITGRCLVRETRKVKRWGKIAEEAAEQCGRAVIPLVHEPLELHDWLMTHSSLQIKGFVFWEEGGVPLHEAFQKVSAPRVQPFASSLFHLFIGPEGGLTKEEVAQAEHHGMIRTTLGRRILRAETAAIVSVALVQFLLEQQFQV